MKTLGGKGCSERVVSSQKWVDAALTGVGWGGVGGLLNSPGVSAVVILSPAERQLVCVAPGYNPSPE